MGYRFEGIVNSIREGQEVSFQIVIDKETWNNDYHPMGWNNYPYWIYVDGISESDFIYTKVGFWNISAGSFLYNWQTETYSSDVNFYIASDNLNEGNEVINLKLRKRIEKDYSEYFSGWPLLFNEESEQLRLMYRNDSEEVHSHSITINDAHFENVSGHQVGTSYHLEYIKDYDGNLHANTVSISDAIKNAYKYQGLIDVNADGTKEAIYTNKESGRWVTGSVNSSGQIDYFDHGEGGTTRIVGIYIDPLVTSGDVVQFSDHDSQYRFQNDLKIDNLLVKTSGDYDSDGFQEVYWKTNDGTAYLRALMHADGNIQYANYQSEDQMSNYLTNNGYESVISDIV